MFPDFEDALMSWAKITFPQLADTQGGQLDEHVGSEAPPNLADRLPFLVVARVGGGDDFITDYPWISIDSFGRTRKDAYDLSEAVRTRLLRTPIVMSGAVIDNSTTRIGPYRAPWSGDRVVRFNIEMELSARRRR